jgi:hypothetical protein
MAPNARAPRGSRQAGPEALKKHDKRSTPLAERDVRRIAREAAREAAREEIARVLGRALDVASEKVFSSRKGHGAPGYSDEENKRIAQAIGTPRGRWWVYTQRDLDAYEQRNRDPKPANVEPTTVRPWHPSESVDEAGLRLVGGGQR